MSKRKRMLESFFDNYRDIFNKGINDELDGEELRDLYSECFIGANPLGVSCGKNDKKLLEVSKEGYSFYRKIGVTSMEIVSKEVNLLDDFHAMVKVRWRSHFIKENSKETLEFENLYFVQTIEDKPKIFGWITPDEQKSLRERGLI